MSDNTLKKIDRFSFSLKEVIGIGSFGKVFKGKDEKTGQNVAVKMMDKRKIQSDEYLMQGLFSEIQVMKKLKSKNVVALLEVLETSNNYYIIQEFCGGGDFRHIIKKKKYLPESEALGVLKDLLSGFTDLLKHGIIHRDLKPENILESNGVYKLADFGFARTVDNFKKQMLDSLVGTPLYMSPQILKHESYTTKSDIWSLALIFYEMLYGKTPWQARSQYELVQKIEREEVTFPETIQVSQQSKDFILKCLSKDEATRISWDDIFKHKLFQGFFDQYIQSRGELENKAIFIINNLRQKIYQERLDLEILFQKYGLSKKSKMDIKAFSTMMLEIDKTLTKQQIEYLFNKFDANGDLEIDFEEFQQWLMDHNVRMSMRDSSKNSTSNPKKAATSHISPEVQARSKEIINNICQTIRQMSFDIQLLFDKFNKSKTQKLDLQELNSMIKSVTPDATKEECEGVFKIFDINEDGYISFQEFKETIQGINQSGNQYSSTNYSTGASNNNTPIRAPNMMNPNANNIQQYPQYQQQMYNQQQYPQQQMYAQQGYPQQQGQFMQQPYQQQPYYNQQQPPQQMYGQQQQFQQQYQQYPPNQYSQQQYGQQQQQYPSQHYSQNQQQNK